MEKRCAYKCPSGSRCARDAEGKYCWQHKKSPQKVSKSPQRKSLSIDYRQLEGVPIDIFGNILNQLKPADIIKLCQSSSLIRNKCKDSRVRVIINRNIRDLQKHREDGKKVIDRIGKLTRISMSPGSTKKADDLDYILRGASSVILSNLVTEKQQVVSLKKLIN